MLATSGVARNFRQGAHQSVARLSLIDKILAHPLGFTRRPITLRNHIPKKLCIFLTGGAYVPYATCMATPLLATLLYRTRNALRPQTDRATRFQSKSCQLLHSTVQPRNKLQRRRNGGTPAMLKPRGREYPFAPIIFSHIFACCSLNFHSLSLCCLNTIKTSHSVGTTGRILRKKLTKHTSPARISINKNSANA